MATKRLDYIATTPIGEGTFRRWWVQPRIQCKDGTSLSVQASGDHCSYPKDDDGPWSSFEVAFVTGADIPKGWTFMGEHHFAIGNHNRDGVEMAGKVTAPFYCVALEDLRAFIEEHGGEVEEEETESVPPDLHEKILQLLEQIPAKHLAFQTARGNVPTVWNKVFAVVPAGTPAAETERIFLEKFADEYLAALKKASETFDEYLALTRQCTWLQEMERAQIAREIEDAGKRL